MAPIQGQSSSSHLRTIPTTIHDAMNNDAWYYLDGQDRRGPFSLEAMKQMLQAGVIQPETWVARQGDSDWGPAATLLSSTQTNIPPPMSPPPASKRGSSKWMIAGAVVLALLVVVFSTNRPEQNRPQPTVESGIKRIFGNPGNSSYQSVPSTCPNEMCGNCGGSGTSLVSNSCSTCGGRGTFTSPSGYAVVCDRCGGSGKVPSPCGFCGGTGRSR